MLHFPINQSESRSKSVLKVRIPLLITQDVLIRCLVIMSNHNVTQIGRTFSNFARKMSDDQLLFPALSTSKLSMLQWPNKYTAQMYLVFLLCVNEVFIRCIQDFANHVWLNLIFVVIVRIGILQIKKYRKKLFQFCI